MLSHRLLYDLQVAAGERDYHLLSYRPQVDHDGFDIILDDRDSLRKLQLKSVCNKATDAWEIHKGILRPSFRTWEQFGFAFDASWGAEGGVILIDVVDKPDSSFAVTYSYTDIYYISLIAVGAISAAAQSVSAANRIRNEIQVGASTDTTDVPRGMFITAKEPSAVLALAGLHSVFNHAWHSFALKSIRSRFDPGFQMPPGENQQILDGRARQAIDEAKGTAVA